MFSLKWIRQHNSFIIYFATEVILRQYAEYPKGLPQVVGALRRAIDFPAASSRMTELASSTCWGHTHRKGPGKGLPQVVGALRRALEFPATSSKVQTRLVNGLHTRWPTDSSPGDPRTPHQAAHRLQADRDMWTHDSAEGDSGYPWVRCALYHAW